MLSVPDDASNEITVQTLGGLNEAHLHRDKRGAGVDIILLTVAALMLVVRTRAALVSLRPATHRVFMRLNSADWAQRAAGRNHRHTYARDLARPGRLARAERAVARRSSVGPGYSCAAADGLLTGHIPGLPALHTCDSERFETDNQPVDLGIRVRSAEVALR